jgi:hypothetical protein
MPASAYNILSPVTTTEFMTQHGTGSEFGLVLSSVPGYDAATRGTGFCFLIFRPNGGFRPRQADGLQRKKLRN